MTINLHVPAKNELLRPTITVIGVGGAGGNAVNNMITANLEGVNFVVANTDAQALDHSQTERTIQLGAGITKGLGAGANPEIGRAAAEEAREEIAAYIEGSNMVFITAGMGGGTGTGAAPVVARIAKEMGALTVAVTTKPFQFEGTHRMKLAEAGLKELQDYVDTLIIIPNQNLFRIANERTTFADAFKMADEVLHSGVRGVTDLMVKPGLINLDFADIRTVMREMGKAMMGTGEASGERRAIEAAEAAISNPLLDDVSLKGARALLISITGGADMSLFEVDEAANRIREEVDPEANIIFGTTLNEAMEGKMRVSVVATGIDAQTQVAAPTQKFTPGEVKRPFAYGNNSPISKPEPVKAAAPAAPAARFSTQQEPVMMTPRSSQPQQLAGGAVRMERPAELPPVPVQAPVQQAAPVHVPVQEAPPPRIRFSDFEREEPVSEPVAQQEAPVERAAVPMFGPASRREQPQQQEMEYDDNGARGGFFKRMADVGRAISGGRPEMSERVQVVQRPQGAEMPARSAKPQADEDQYLDIPAFLRRQAN
jgi:cell division protein FtsZ